MIDDSVLLKRFCGKKKKNTVFLSSNAYSDGFPTYHLASVVDDHLMEITTVLRGEVCVLLKR